jgi:hypothetical protein
MTLVFDPRLGKHGGWTRYDLPLGSYVRYEPPLTGDVGWFALHSNAAYLIGLHNDIGEDHLTTTDTPYESMIMTKFYDLGNPALVKRWKHPIFVVDADTTEQFDIQVYKDYSMQTALRSFNLDVIGAGDGMVWGSGLWGTGLWGGTAAGAQSIEKGGLLGRGTSIALCVRGPESSAWGCNSITFKYIPRKIRS